MAAGETTRVCVGAIAGAHGVRGEVRIKAFTEEPLDVAAYGPLETEDGARLFEVSSARLQKDHVVARLDGIASRDAALELKGTRLYVPRERLPETADDETWYHADLIGLAAMLPGGRPLGSVVAVQDFGAGDLLEIQLEGSRQTVLVPFTRERVPKVDMAGRCIIIDPPPGNDDDAPAGDG